MIRAPLTFHQPQQIYNYLQEKLGTLSMIIKKGQALITFDQQKHNRQALLKYKITYLKGHPLRLFQYKDGDLDRKIDSIQIQPPSISITQGNIGSTQLISETSKMVDEAITIQDPNDQLEVITKNHFKQVIQSISKFKPIYNTAKSKQKQFLSKPSIQDQNKAKQLLKFTNHQLNDVKSNVIGIYKKTRHQISKYGIEEQIDLDPSLNPTQIAPTPIYSSKYQPCIQFINQEANIQVKKLALLNEEQFICTNHLIEPHRQIPKGKVKVYNCKEEYEIMGTILSQSCYALCIVDKYILTGNLQGSISFWNSNQGSISLQNPFEISNRIHESLIFDIIKNGTNSSGFGLATLGTDQKIKLIQVSQQSIIDDMMTLFFKEVCVFDQGRQIFSIQMLEERQKLISGSWNKVQIYDLITNKICNQYTQKYNVYKVKKMSKNLITIANGNTVSFNDIRTPGNTSSLTCFLNQQIKALAPINQYVTSYGGMQGQIGLIDQRRVDKPLWRDYGTHHSRIYDILKINNMLISGDQKGQLVGWKGIE